MLPPALAETLADTVHFPSRAAGVEKVFDDDAPDVESHAATSAAATSISLFFAPFAIPSLTTIRDPAEVLTSTTAGPSGRRSLRHLCSDRPTRAETRERPGGRRRACPLGLIAARRAAIDVAEHALLERAEDAPPRLAVPVRTPPRSAVPVRTPFRTRGLRSTLHQRRLANRTR